MFNKSLGFLQINRLSVSDPIDTLLLVIIINLFVMALHCYLLWSANLISIINTRT